MLELLHQRLRAKLNGGGSIDMHFLKVSFNLKEELYALS